MKSNQAIIIAAIEAIAKSSDLSATAREATKV
ncbi:unannotated protein [freshwater metagenome]|uniref:Unannotated protein n=1 Tax=freshwater metagenome TaxID=449393 RepID=A0A6J6DB33_9ZZZZ